MNLFGMLEISGSAMTAERERAQIVTSNMANAQTTKTTAGGPYKRQLAIFRSQPQPPFPMMLAVAGAISSRGEGVRVAEVVPDRKPPILRYEPGNPEADAKGYVAYPAIDPIEEMADLLGSVRAYELNASAIAATKSMIQQSLDILK
jgi:flagellar basal-body rod protein FlgC